MNYELRKISFPSADGKNTVSARIYVPKDKEIIGVVQLSHGMIDHVERYELLADYLTGEGYVFAGNDHLGHGLTANSEDDFGFFADKNGIDALVADLHSMNDILRKTFPKFKPVIMGHSMGSFLSRLYVNEHPDTVSGHIIHGTGGPMGIVLPLGKALVNVLMLFRGKRHRSVFVAKASFLGYNSKFPKEDGMFAWLSRDLSRVNEDNRNKYTMFIFTLSAYRDLFGMIGKSNSEKWFKKYPKGMPTLIMSGGMDPVGKYGKGPKCVFRRLSKKGVSSVELKLYDGARHELFNETCKDEVFRDMKAWLSGALK